MKLGICNELFGDRSLDDAFKFVSGLGYDGIELAPWTFTSSATQVSEEEVKKVKSAADNAQIEIIGLHWFFGSDTKYHLTHPEKEVRLQFLEYLKALVGIGSTLECKIMTFGSPNQRRIPEGVKQDEAWGYAKEVLGNDSFLKQLQDSGITFCLESLSEDQTNFINSAEEAIQFVEEVNHPNFQMMLDGYSLTWEKKDIHDIIKASGSHLKHFHADDEMKKGPGYGSLDYKPIAKSLSDIGYDGYVSIEVHDFDLDPEETATRCIKYLRQIFG